MQSNRKVARAGLLMTAVATLCRVLSALKELLVAYVFGANFSTDAYALALLIPAIGTALFVTATRQVFLADSARHAQRGSREFVEYANRYVTSLLLAAIAVAVLTALGLRAVWRYLLVFGDPATRQAAAELLLPASLLIIPTAAVMGLTSILNAQGRFALPHATAVIPSVCIVVAVALRGSEGGALVLILGLLAGTALRALALTILLAAGGFRLRFQWDWRSPMLQRLWGLALPLIPIDLLWQANAYVDRTLATWLPDGKVAVLYWSSLLMDFIEGTLIASLLTVLLPHFSRQVAEGTLDQLRRSGALVLRYAALVLFPLSALMCLTAPVLFRSLPLGRLDETARLSLAYCLAAYGPGLFAGLSSTALSQILLTLGRRRAMLLVAIAGSFLPNLGLNLLLIRPLGEVGLALSTALVSYLTFGCNYFLVRRALGIVEESYNLRVIATSLLATLTAAGGGGGVLLATQRRGWLDDALRDDLLAIALGTLVFAAIYLFWMLVFPGNREARTGVRMLWEAGAGRGRGE